MLSAVGPAGVAGGMTTRVRHVGAGAGASNGMVVVPRGRGKLGGGGSVGPEMLVVDTVDSWCVVCGDAEGTVGGIVEIDGG
jgi:hypothetical protein